MKYKIIGLYESMGALPKIPNLDILEETFEALTDEEALEKGREIWKKYENSFPNSKFIEVVKSIGYIKIK